MRNVIKVLFVTLVLISFKVNRFTLSAQPLSATDIIRKPMRNSMGRNPA